MKAIIMAGGFGTRLRPLTINAPKPMVPIANIPIMEHVVTLLKRHGITDITSLLYFQADKIKDHFKDGSEFGVKMNYVKPDDDYGTAGAVRFALEDYDGKVLIISGDLITDFDLSEALKWHDEKKSEATLLLTRIENPLAYGIVITEENGKITQFLEKPTWGEAFSDTINTGIYILEKEAYKLIPYKANFDFSQDLYPKMLNDRMGLYGKIMTGYWKDVGNLSEYQLVHVDIFENKLQLDFPREFVKSGETEIQKGDNIRIGEEVEFSGKVIVGNNCVIENGCKLHNVVVGDNSKIASGSVLKNSVIWDNVAIGQKTEMDSAIVCRKTRIGSSVKLHDNVIISEDCVLGDSVTVKANCKIWPGKTIDDGAIVSTSMVWGEKWNRELFSDAKITGLALTEITPEMAVKIGAAFGAYLSGQSEVIVSRDASDTSRLLKRALIAGLLAGGVNIADIETLPVPVVRHCLNKGNYSAGIYIRHNPEDYRMIDMIFFDGSGLDLPTSATKKIERLYFGEDFERASLDNTGHLEMPQYPLEDYRNDFMEEINQEEIKRAGFKIVIDHSNGSSSEIFPNLFSQLGISSVELNASLNPRKLSGSSSEIAQSLVQLSSIVTSLNADFGFHLNPAAEKLTVVDESGKLIDNQLLLLIVTDLFLQTHECKKIAVTVNASAGIEMLAKEYGVEVIRVPSDHLSMMKVFISKQADFVGGTKGGFIFPGFQTGADAILAVVKILEMVAQTKTKFGQLRKKFEQFISSNKSVPCSWSKKGTVMRKLIINSAEQRRELIDGVRLFEESGWVLVTPDRVSASFNITAESESPEKTKELIEKYSNLVNEYQLED